MSELKNYWVSWYDLNYGCWEYHGPWWISGERMDDGAKTIVLAVQAENEEEAENAVYEAQDDPTIPLEFRFVTEKPGNWNPLAIEGGRFPSAEWMVWPMNSQENLQRVTRPA